MVATLAQAASASYYLESQCSFRHPNEYYTAGEEPDGVWFNPKGLLGLENGGKVDSGDFHRLYNGFAPDGSHRLNARAACRASLTVSASSAPRVRLTTAPPVRRCTIHVLCPFARARSPSPGAALSHSTASRPSAGVKARARASVMFVLFGMVRSLPFVSVATGAARASPVGEHPGQAG